MTRRLAGILMVTGTALAVPGLAQVAPPATPEVVARADSARPTRKQAGEVAGGNGAPAYRDNLIADGTLEPDIWRGEVPETNTSGWPRGLRLDAIYSHQSLNALSLAQYGLGISGFLATPHYGTFTLDGVVGKQQGDGVLTLWQRDVPFDGGWRASNGLGTLNSAAIDLTRQQQRWIVPTTPMMGGSTEWRDAGGTQLLASVGQPGVYTGVYVPGFRRLDGTVTGAGGQWNLGPRWTVGLQYQDAHEVTSVFQLRPDAQRFSTSSWFGAAAWADGTTRVQFNALGSDTSLTQSGLGAWVDATIQDGRYQHGFGLFYMGTALVWANQLVGSDTRGAYYRINYGSRQWWWDLMLDYAAPTGESQLPAATFASGSVRYQFGQGLGVGAGANVRHTDGTAWSAYTYVEKTWPLLINRNQIYAASNQDQRELTLSASQTWNVPAGTRLSTSALIGRYDDGRNTSQQYGFSVFGGGDLAPQLSLDANVQWLNSTGEATPTTLLGNLGLTYRFLPQLSLIATLYRNQTRGENLVVVESPLAALSRRFEERINGRGVAVTLRFEERAGSMAPPLGGAPGGGAGRLSGVVFLDANESGRFEAGEQGVANVTVVLDGRYAVRTDAQGRYEFPAVAAGRHRLSVLPDNLPLPWMLVNEGQAEVEVSVRGNVSADVAARRNR